MCQGHLERHLYVVSSQLAVDRDIKVFSNLYLADTDEGHREDNSQSEQRPNVVF